MRRFPAKFLIALCAPLIMAACATVGPPQPPSLALPKPPSDLRAQRKGEHVTLTWTAPSVTTDRQTIRSLGPTRICRGIAKELIRCDVPVGEVPALPVLAGPRSGEQKPIRSYTDSLAGRIQSEVPSAFDNPSAFATYAVEVLNGQGRSAGLSNQARVSLVGTLPPPQNFAGNVTGQGVVLTWTGVAPAGSTQPVHYLYRVYRRLEGGTQQTLVGDVTATSERRFSLTDSNIEWEKTYDYRAETVTVVALANEPEIQVEGDDAPEIKVFAHDVFPPAVPSGLQAVSSGPGQKKFIDLVWAPVADLDLDGYNVYRHEEGMAVEKVNAELVKTPAYRDENVMSGKRYFYSVSAVDVRGNESGRSEEASETLP